MPFVALVIVLREVVPLRLRLDHFESRVAREGAQAVGVHAPAVNRKAMFRSARWNKDAADRVDPQSARDLAHRFPKKFGVLEGLPGHDDVRAIRREFLPIVRIGQHDIDIVPEREIDADVTPWREIEERPIRSVDVLAAEIENHERLGSAPFEILPAECRHFVEGALVHLRQ